MAGERFDRRRVAGLFGALLGFAPEAFAQGRGVPKSADDIVTDDMTLDKYEAMAEKLRAAALENRNRPKPPPAAAPAGGKVGTSQWELIRETFRGRWTGPTKWFGRAPDASAALNWETPSVDIPKSVYDISFSDANTGVWRGTGLRFTDKELVLNLNGPGSSRTTCMFPGGLGMQSSIEMSSSSQFGHPANEVNFFDDRARSMLISRYTSPPGRAPQLDSIGATPFRDALAPSAPGPRSPYPTPKALLDSVKGWKGEQLTRVPDDWGPGQPDSFDRKAATPVALDAGKYEKQPVCRVFVDNLIFAGPETLSPGQPFDLVYGCKLSDKEYKEVVIKYDKDFTLTSWNYAVYRA